MSVVERPRGSFSHGFGITAACAGIGWRHPWAVLVGFVVLACVSIRSGCGMRFRSGVTDLAPSSIARSIERIERSFGISNSLLLLVSIDREGEEECLVEFAGGIASALAEEPKVADVRYGVADFENRLVDRALLSRALLFAGPEDIEELDRLLSPDGIRETVRKQGFLLDLPGAEDSARWIEKDPLELRRFVIRRLGRAGSGLRFRKGSPWFLSEDGKSLLVRIKGRVRSSNPGHVRLLMAAVDRAIETSRASLAQQCPHAGEVAVGRAGGYALAFESAGTMRRDLQVNIGVSVLLVLTVLWIAWRRVVIVVLGALPVVFGVILGFGIFSIFVREVVVLALVSGAVLAALGIDFVIHLLEPLRGKGRCVVGSDVEGAARHVGHSLVLAAITTIVAFLSFVLASDGFLRAMGVLTACGIAACLVSALFVLPAVLSVCRSRAVPASDPDAATRLPRRRFERLSPAALGVRLGEWSAANSRLVLVFASLASAACGAFLVMHPPEVETDLRRIHASDSEAVRVQARLGETFGFIDDPVLLLIGDPRGAGRVLDAVARLEPELEELSRSGSVAGWTAVTTFVPPPVEQEDVLAILTRKDATGIGAALRRALQEEGFEAAAFNEAIEVVESAVGRTKILSADEVAGIGFAEEVRPLLSSARREALAMIPVRPALTLWEAEHRDRLFSDLRRACRKVGVEVDIAGLHAASSEAASFVVEHFVEGTGIALGAVVLLVTLLLRRGSRIVAALVPVTLGCLWTVTVWSWLGWKVHFMNVGILPMILGVGIDDGIHLVSRYARAPAEGVNAVLRSTSPAVVLTTFTTLAAFGTLAFSSTQGLASVGVLCTLGVSSCLLASLVVLPAVLALEGEAGGDGGRDEKAVVRE